MVAAAEKLVERVFACFACFVGVSACLGVCLMRVCSVSCACSGVFCIRSRVLSEIDAFEGVGPEAIPRAEAEGRTGEQTVELRAGNRSESSFIWMEAYRGG